MLGCPGDVSAWIDALPQMKQEMDWWFSKNPKNEREVQQWMVRENNFGKAAKCTDYFICDIEYDANQNGRFDLIAAHWPSSGPSRKNNQKVGLAFIEMKYMNQSMVNKSGIRTHIENMRAYFSDHQDNFAVLKEEMRTIFNQKLELGLIDSQKPIERFDAKTPDFILAIANHDPGSAILRQEIEAIKASQQSLPFKLKFAYSNFMGYGLYDQNVIELDEFMDRFAAQI